MLMMMLMMMLMTLIVVVVVMMSRESSLDQPAPCSHLPELRAREVHRLGLLTVPSNTRAAEGAGSSWLCHCRCGPLIERAGDNPPKELASLH